MKNIILVLCILPLLAGPKAFGQSMTVADKISAGSEGIREWEKIRFRPVWRDRRGKVRVAMDRPLVVGDEIYLRLKLSNRSAISYDVDFFRFVVRDRKIARRTITQEQELRPVRSVVPEMRVAAGWRLYFVFVLDKFTLANKKVLRCEVFEDGGGRHFQIQVKDRELNHAVLVTGI
ncbi:MAG TPA: DUF4138 domain-containing protein [Sphingobacteriaceae bacterium]